MALARLALKNLHQRVLSYPSSSSSAATALLINRNAIETDHTKRPLSTESDNKIAVESSDHQGKEAKRSKSSFPWKPRKRGLWSWRSRNDRELNPSLLEFFPSVLGNSLMQASENMNRVLEKLNLSPMIRVKEQKECYKLSLDVPGLRKEDLKIVVEDGVLVISGERKEEKSGCESDCDDEDSSFSRMFGYYHTNLSLPEDAKVDEIRAQLKNGVLCVVVPRTPALPQKHLIEVQIQ